MKVTSGLLGVVALICLIVSLKPAALWITNEPLMKHEQWWPIYLLIGLLAGLLSAWAFTRSQRSAA